MTSERDSPGSSDEDGPCPDCPVIDAHVHVLPTELLSAISEWFTEKTDWTIPTPSPATVVERTAQRTDGFVFFPYAHRPGVAASLNEFAADWQSRADAAVGLGTVHAADDAPAQVVSDLFERGLHGVKIHCPVQGFRADDARLDSVYEALVDRDAPLVIHASTHPFYRGEEDLGAVPLQDVLERYPSLRVCVPHLGLFETEAFLDLADEYELYLDTAVALGDETHDLIGLRDADLSVDRLRSHGDRIMFGTDYPIRPQSYEAAFDGVRETFPDQYPDVLYGNASEFFGFENAV
ncbi:hypothetical protein SAMN04487948_10767 [Halogranum amylolyticum]|uniref:Amidohydrolase-related domain-containing protein n=1 Tax=Halogranum amylolyticum TaxID=660520 RepID=A0A1H8TI61_9EURY|nr:amidohydrolase family protein [Halogranum amylolyticum]SEO90525.1 hypothetical protein SAMN04487948_10767 [Halogranum amylolyticum]